MAKIKVTENEFLRQVLGLAKLYKWRSAHFRPGMNRRGVWQTAVAGDGKGFPDLVLIRGDTLLAIELKVGRNKVEPEQQVWLDAFSGVPGCYAMEWRPQMWDQIAGILEHGYGPVVDS